ncbi:MAG TPA: GTP cyclohydrolase II [Dyella sp.]|nr:GTP cyclohydrolase II [Dyella sp.]
MTQTHSVQRIVSTYIPTQWGEFQLLAFERIALGGGGRTEGALALILGNVLDGVPLLRVHSQCLTSEVFGSLRCDCNDQLQISLRRISSEKCGLLIYELQEGRGIGLMAKLRAYALQDGGLDTVEANLELGFAADYRDFSLASAILHELGVTRVRLLSNNPRKAHALTNAGIAIVERIPCEAMPNSHSLPYLRTKKEKLGHLLSLEQVSSTNHAAASADEHVSMKLFANCTRPA